MPGGVNEVIEAESIKEEDTASLLSQPLDFVGVAGFALYLAWFYLMLTSSIAGASELSRSTETLLVIAFIAGEACCSLILPPCAKRIGSRGIIRVLAVISAMLLVLPGGISIVTDSETMLFAAWFLSGIGALLAVALWGFFLALLSHRQAVVYLTLSAIGAVLVFGLVKVALKHDMWPYASIVIALMCILLFFYWAIRRWSSGEVVYPRKTRPYDVKALLHTAGAMVANNFLLGYGLYAIGSSSNETGIALMVGAMLAATVFKLVDVKTGPRYQVSMIIKVIAPVATIVLLMMPFAPVGVRYALIAFMLLFAVIDETICWTAVSEYMHIHQVHPFANVAFGRFAADVVGIGLGFICGSQILGPMMEGEVSFGIYTSIVVIAFVCMQAFVFRDNYTPLIAHKDVEEDLAEEHVEQQEDRHHGSWQRRCHRFAEHYDLTPRQTEVLLLIARGYSMKSIEEQLVVSSHTVKAHVYGIYQKADIHSRQQLMNQIAQFEDDWEENAD